MGKIYKVKVYNQYEADYLRNAAMIGESVTSNFQLWEDREVDESELLNLVRRGEKVLVNCI